MKDKAKWWLVHALHWVVLYGAFAAEIDGALHVLKFFVWVMALLSLFLFTEEAITAATRKTPRPIRDALSMLQAWVTLGLLVWFGHIATALAWGVVMVIVTLHRAAVTNRRASVAASSV